MLFIYNMTVHEQPSSLSSTDQTGTTATTPDSDPVVEPTYFKEFSFHPSLIIKIDYEAKRFDMEKVHNNNYSTYVMMLIYAYRESYLVF